MVSAVLLSVYFLPSIVAYSRGHYNATSIAMTNLLLGWTGIGWIVALVWSVSALPAAKPVLDQPT